MQRINWIDWAKAWCMTVVVFDHTPHDGSSFLLQFLAGTNLATFFFISGYLKKPSISHKESFKKYAYGLVVPYFIYNAIFYPYWLAKFYIEHGEIALTDAIKPIIGTLLGQLDSSFSSSLNGVTWFLVSLLLMHIITDYCNRQKNRILIMLTISLIAMSLYGANKYYHFAPYLTFHGLVRCISFFFIGNLMRQCQWLEEVRIKRELAVGIIASTISLIIFYKHITENNFIIHIILFFVVNIISIFAILCICRSANNIHSRVIYWISIGTMMIFGLHRILLGILNWGFEKTFHLNNIIYTINEAVIIALGAEVIIIPLIIYTYNKFPILLGHKKYQKRFDDSKYLCNFANKKSWT